MRAEKDRDWELPFGNPGDLAVLMDIRDELKQLNRQLALLAIELEGRKATELPPLPVTDGAPPVIATTGTGRGTTAYPPPAPTPPPPRQAPPVTRAHVTDDVDIPRPPKQTGVRRKR